MAGEQVSLGKRIKKRRQALKITQQELAQGLGITPQHISAIERDKWTPSITLLPKLAEELGVSVDHLVSGKESVITDTIPAIKADKSLPLEVKRALITLVNNSRTPLQVTSLDGLDKHLPLIKRKGGRGGNYTKPGKWA